MPRFERFTAWLFDGSLSDFNRQMMMHIFQTQDLPKVMAMSLKAGGVGLTLTRANHVYHFDSWWNPATASQAEDSVHRIGQKLPVYVTTMLTKGTIEERIFNLMNEKRELFRKVMDPLTATGGEERAIAKQITKDDMISLLK
jgi:SNF2 family DNA or RNA helicase